VAVKKILLYAKGGDCDKQDKDYADHYLKHLFQFQVEERACHGNHRVLLVQGKASRFLVTSEAVDVTGTFQIRFINMEYF